MTGAIYPLPNHKVFMLTTLIGGRRFSVMVGCSGYDFLEIFVFPANAHDCQNLWSVIPDVNMISRSFWAMTGDGSLVTIKSGAEMSL